MILGQRSNFQIDGKCLSEMLTYSQIKYIQDICHLLYGYEVAIICIWYTCLL